MVVKPLNCWYNNLMLQRYNRKDQNSSFSFMILIIMPAVLNYKAKKTLKGSIPNCRIALLHVGGENLPAVGKHRPRRAAPEELTLQFIISF